MGRLLVLGTPEVCVGADTRIVAGVRRQSLLGVLVVRRNADVAVDVLIDRIWGRLQRPAALRALRSEVHRLRDALSGCVTIETRPGAYRLRAGAADVDLDLFEFEADATRNVLEADPAAAVHHADRALALWRGRPFGELVDVPELLAEQRRLDDARLALRELRVDGLLAVGHDPDQLIAELSELTDRWPFRERFWAQLMLALWRAGRQADALAAFQRARTVLVEQLGLEPTEHLRRLEASILAQDVADPVGQARWPAAITPPEAPVLIPDVWPSVRLTSLVGRDAQLAELEDVLRARRLLTPIPLS